MLRRFRGRCAWMVGPLSVLLLVNPMAEASAGRGGHGSGGGHRSAPRPPAHASAMRTPSSRPARMPHPAAAASRNHSGMAQSASIPHNNGAVGHNSGAHNNSVAASNGGTQTNSSTRNLAGARASNHGTSSMSLAARVATIHPPSSYSYRSSAGTNSSRNYRPSGYGRGYRNRYYGNSRNYGRSQSNDRSIVARLRSVHRTLTRIDHDYQGHRARAAHQISLAIRHLSHRSSYSGSNGMSGSSNLRLTGLNGNQNQNQNGINGLNGNRLQNQNGTGLNNGRRAHLTQAQSDSLMSQALRTTQGVSLQLSQQSQNYSSHRLAHARIQHAMHEMNVALTVR